MIDLPLAAASPIAAVLTDLFVVLLAAKLGDELFKADPSAGASSVTSWP